MYVPASFKENRPKVLAAAIREAGLATLVTLGTDGLSASHVPMLLEPSPAPHGTLVGHIARANPQWRDPVPAVPALAIFTGPDYYVTPSWYPSKQAHGRVVPTWNYVAIHAYGSVTFFDDTERLRDLVTRLTERHEALRAEPWAVSDAPAPFVSGMLNGIVGFALAVERLEGKWKMSQNRDAADRQGVADGLLREGRAELARTIGPDDPA